MSTMMPSKAFVVVALAVIAGSSQALVAYNNFGPGDAFNPTTAYLIGSTQWDGFQFTSLNSGILDKITIPISTLTTKSNVTVGLYQDSGGSVGSLMKAWSFTTTDIFGNPFTPQVLVNALPSVTLNSGSAYWVVTSSSDPTLDVGWNFNSTGGTSDADASTDGGLTWISFPNQPQGAFRVEVKSSSVPGPGAILPFALGLVGVIRRRRR